MCLNVIYKKKKKEAVFIVVAIEIQPFSINEILVFFFLQKLTQMHAMRPSVDVSPSSASFVPITTV